VPHVIGTTGFDEQIAARRCGLQTVTSMLVP
jgi:hypothetical protein